MVLKPVVSDKFDELLLLAIDETMKYVLGEANAAIIYCYLERNNCIKEEIPGKLEFFSAALCDLIGCSRGQILGAAAILEEAIAESFALKVGVGFEKYQPMNFAEYIELLRRKCLEKR